MEIVKDVFVVKEIDMIPIDPSRPSVKIKKKIFPKVSRIYSISETRKLEFILDVNTDIYNISVGDRLELLIVEPFLQTSIGSHGENSSTDWFQRLDKDLIAQYEYVMHGMVFHSGMENHRTFFYASFGGLLLKIFGELGKNTRKFFLKMDSNILLLIRKNITPEFLD
jgi:DNA-directed RNA polymerase I, II, and III subunit RPABC3